MYDRIEEPYLRASLAIQTMGALYINQGRHDEIYNLFMSQVWRLPENARRILQAATIEAHSRTGTYVIMTPVMNRANLSDVEEFRFIAEYLQGKGWIAEADPDYGIFVLTPEGIDEAMI